MWWWWGAGYGYNKGGNFGGGNSGDSGNCNDFGNYSGQRQSNYVPMKGAVSVAEVWQSLWWWLWI